MGYSPVELRHVTVRRRLFGYDGASVQEILNDVADSFEAVWRDRGELADKVEALEGELDELRRREQTLANTLVAAERAADELREHGKREASRILMEAHGEARAVLRSAHEERERLLTESRRIEALLRAALEVVGEAAATSAARRPLDESVLARLARREDEIVESPAFAGTTAAAPPAEPAAPDTSAAEVVPVAGQAADGQPDDLLVEEASDERAEDPNVGEAPGWPPLREVAHGSGRFEWGD